MRLMIIGIIAFGLATLAMVIADGRLLRTLGVASLWGGDVKQVRFTTSNWIPNQSLDEIIIPMPQGHWKTMSGFPSYASLEFPLPQHTSIEEGRLVLEFSLQMPPSGGGAIRVMINNDKRADLLLDHSQKKYRLLIELNDNDVQQEQLLISLSTDGYGASGECPDDRSRVAVIEITPKTRLELQLAKPIEHPADAAILAGNPIRLLVSDQAAQRARERLLALANKLDQGGVDVQFVADEEFSKQIAIRVDPKTSEARFDQRTKQIIVSGPRDAALLLSNLRKKNHPAPSVKNNQTAISVELFGASIRAKHFRHEVKWRIAYALKDMPKGKAPGQFDLNIFHSLVPNRSKNLLSVIFNDNLLHSMTAGEQKNMLTQNILLPLDKTRLENVIEVSILTNEDRIGVCNPGREALAQLLKASAVTDFQTLSAKRFESIPGDISATGQLQLYVPHKLQAPGYHDSLLVLRRVTPSKTKIISSEAPITGARATIIPLDLFRAEIEKYLDEGALTGSSFEKNGQSSRIWIAAAASVLGTADPAAQFAPLTRGLANKIGASHQRGVVIILQLPPSKDSAA